LAFDFGGKYDAMPIRDTVLVLLKISLGLKLTSGRGGFADWKKSISAIRPVSYGFAILQFT
jgi:hypothetical protein